MNASDFSWDVSGRVSELAAEAIAGALTKNSFPAAVTVPARPLHFCKVRGGPTQQIASKRHDLKASQNISGNHAAIVNLWAF